MNKIILENQSLRLTFDRTSGALEELTALKTGWAILDRAQLGLSFQLLVPLRDSGDWLEPGRRNNQVLGEKQTLTALDCAADGRAARFVWDGVVSELGGPLPIKVTLDVALSDRQASFKMHIENGSAHTIEAAYCPYIGDVQRPPTTPWFKTFLYQYATAQEWALWPTYQNLRGYFGVDYPTQFGSWSPGTGAPMSPYILLQGEHEGLYVGISEASPELVAWHTELRPGYGSSIDARVPEERSVSGLEVATRFAAVHMPFIQPGESRTLTPVVLEPYQGDWHAGVDIYKAWRSGWMRTPDLPEWARAPHAWQQIQINSPEDELRFTFRDLVKVAEECARHGVKAIQLTGWVTGGQDQGNPAHDPDPRLGTWDELKAAIAECHAMGVQIILFSKFTWADRATEWFRKELVKQAIKDPYGDYHVHPGYQYHTATQLLDINTKRLVPMCFLSEAYLDICEAEFQKTVDLGAAGILFDECLHHSPTLLCFATNHGHRYGAPVYANDRELIQRFARRAGPDFLFAGEACYDWEFEAYHLSYHRSESKSHIPLSRYMLPDVPLATAVTGFNDRNMINQCLLYRYIISYEPYNFKGHLDDYPLTMAYGKQMDALRTELRAYFWDGEFRDTVGGRVTCDGQPHHPFAVFCNRANGQSAVAVANYDESAAKTVEVALESGERLSRYRLVDDPAWRSTRDGVHLPPASAAVVIP